MAVPLYNAEIAPPEVRGSLVALQQLAITFGIMISFWIDYGRCHLHMGAGQMNSNENQVRTTSVGQVLVNTRLHGEFLLLSNLFPPSFLEWESCLCPFRQGTDNLYPIATSVLTIATTLKVVG